jgi:hypothetical protein
VTARFSAWSPAGTSDYVYHGALPPGRYTVILDFVWDDPDRWTSASLLIESGVAHPSPVVYTLLILAAGPFLVGLYQLVWEQRRWAESSAGGGE